MTISPSNANVAASGRSGHIDTIGEAFWVWLRISLLSFGGPAGQIAVMHRILVDEKRWISDERFLHALNYCMLLPGPEAQQLATYVGWLMHRTRGGLMAGGLFVLPGAIAIMALSWVYVLFGNVGIVGGIFFGLKAAVIGIVLEAVIRVGKRALKNTAMRSLAAIAFVTLFFFAVPFPVVILAAALIGYVGTISGNPAFRVSSGHGSGANKDGESLLGETVPEHAKPNLRRSLMLAGIWLALWLGPVAVLILVLGPNDLFSQMAVFFSKMALVTFGGAYAVLSYVAQEVVGTYGWVRPGEMLDGLGLAETTPGPLIMVLQFVGFLAAYRTPHMLSPLLAATLRGLLVTWVTFIPCFLWIFIGAPYIEVVRGNKALSGAMAAITAAVAGVILNLAVWFAIHALFSTVVPFKGYGLVVDIPVITSLNPWAALLSAAAVLAVIRFKVAVLLVLPICAAFGVGLHLLRII